MPRPIHLEGHEPESRSAGAPQVGWALVAAMMLMILAMAWGIASGVL
jgi:hypothetical protein